MVPDDLVALIVPPTILGESARHFLARQLLERSPRKCHELLHLAPALFLRQPPIGLYSLVVEHVRRLCSGAPRGTRGAPNSTILGPRWNL